MVRRSYPERHRALADGADGAGLREDEAAENALDGVVPKSSSLS
jgi:hypothetical protein